MGNSCWKKLKPFIILIQFIVSLASLVTNWLLFVDINNVNPGLVFGPFPPEFRHTVLAFCVLSTILNMLEIYFLWTELFRRHSNCYISGNVSSALIIWLDDIPKAIFMIYISSCHDRTISIAEIARSCLLLVTAVIRIIAFSVRELRRKRRESHGLPTREELAKRNKPCRCCVYGAITLGILLKIVAFLLLFFLNNITSIDGGIAFKNPKGVLNAEPNVAKYTQNVSIYAKIHNRNETWGWFPLVPLKDVTFLKNCTSKLLLTKNKTRVEFSCGPDFKSAREVDKSPITIDSHKVEIQHRFLFIEPSSRLLLGNVEYKTLSTKGLAVGAEVQLQYFCSGVRSSKDTLGFVFGLVPKKEFDYKGDKVLGSDERVSQAPYCWKTGKFKCEMRGMTGPKKVTAFSQ